MIEINKLVRPAILQLEPYSSARDEFKGKEGIFLDANENPFGTLNRYPDPHQSELKEKLGELRNINPTNIVIGNGSDEIIDMTIRIFCEPGQDKLLAFHPSYGMYKVAAAVNNVELVELQLNDSFQIDVGKLEPYLTDDRLKIIFICSPNNPTGNLINLKDIEFILQKFQGIIFLDEAYIDFANSDSSTKLIQKYNNLIVSQTFSKAWGLAGARVGVGYAQEEIISYFKKVKPPYNVSQLNQDAAIKAIENITQFEACKDEILNEKQRLTTALSNHKLVLKIYPSAANFILIEVTDADLIYTKLTQQKIITRNRNTYVPNCLRISIGTKDENDLFLCALQKIANEKSSVYR